MNIKNFKDTFFSRMSATGFTPPPNLKRVGSRTRFLLFEGSDYPAGRSVPAGVRHFFAVFTVGGSLLSSERNPAHISFNFGLNSIRLNYIMRVSCSYRITGCAAL